MSQDNFINGFQQTRTQLLVDLISGIHDLGGHVIESHRRNFSRRVAEAAEKSKPHFEPSVNMTIPFNI